jgi:Response regulator containing a CheY-like receiver domain and a GGDEF domain
MDILKEKSLENVSVLAAIEHPASAQLITDQLERRGVQTARVEDGNDALDVLRDAPPDLMVAQTRLPGRTGLELLRQVPHLDPAVVLLGRKGNDEMIVRAFEFGAADYITRPFSPRVATARILRLLTMRKSLWEESLREENLREESPSDRSTLPQNDRAEQ